MSIVIWTVVITGVRVSARGVEKDDATYVEVHESGPPEYSNHGSDGAGYGVRRERIPCKRLLAAFIRFNCEEPTDGVHAG